MRGHLGCRERRLWGAGGGGVWERAALAEAVGEKARGQRWQKRRSAPHLLDAVGFDLEGIELRYRSLLLRDSICQSCAVVACNRRDLQRGGLGTGREEARSGQGWRGGVRVKMLGRGYSG